ncbi:MAG: hypothetical protein ABJF05_12250, partial [Paracoccaceae bacterium]
MKNVTHLLTGFYGFSEADQLVAPVTLDPNANLDRHRTCTETYSNCRQLRDKAASWRNLLNVRLPIRFREP